MQFNFAKPLGFFAKPFKEKESTGVILVPKIRRRRNRKVHKLGNQEIWSGFLTQGAWQWNITLISVVLKFSSVIQIFRSLALYAIGRVSCTFRKRSFHPIQFVSHEKCFIGFLRGFSNNCDHLHFFVENVLEALKRHSKQKSTIRRQFQN